MLGLNQDTVDLIVAIAVAHVVPWLAVLIAAMLSRQVGRFGFTGAWGGSDSKDIRINGY